MMELHQQIPLAALNEAEHEFLKGVKDKVKRVDEVHPSEDNDTCFIFLVWLLNVDDEQEVIAAIKKNIAEEEARGESPWEYEVTSHFGFIVVTTWI